MELDDFIGRYTANYGEFPGNLDNALEMREWLEIVRSLPTGKAQTAFAMINEQLGKSGRKPRVREFSAIMGILADAPTFVNNDPKGCLDCDYAGHLHCAVHMSNDKWKIGFKEGARPYDVVIHCSCGLGRMLKEKNAKGTDLDGKQLALVREWICKQEQNARYAEQSYDYFMHLEFVKYCKLAPIKTVQPAGMHTEPAPKYKPPADEPKVALSLKDIMGGMK